MSEETPEGTGVPETQPTVAERVRRIWLSGGLPLWVASAALLVAVVALIVAASAGDGSPVVYGAGPDAGPTIPVATPGDDDGDMVADVAHFALRQHRMGARLHRRAVLGMDHPAADQAADLIGCDVVAGENRLDARRALRRGEIDLVDRGVSMRRAKKVGIGLSRPIDVVGVMSLACEEADVFLALYGCAYAGRVHINTP